MKEKRILILKALLSVLLSVVVLFACSWVYIPKWIYGNNPQTLQIKPFSDQSPNSIDVIALGSCQTYSGFNPCTLWKTSHITSYVLGSPEQKLYTSYYYLKYALKKQKPKVVIIDALFLAQSNNGNESYDKKAYFSMPLSVERLALADTSFEIKCPDEKRKTASYYTDRAVNIIKAAFPTLEFHARDDMGERDIKYLLGQYVGNDGNGGVYNGGVQIYQVVDLTEYSDFMNTKNKKGEIDSIADEYFIKIKSLCDDNDIKLIVIKTLSPTIWNFEKHICVKKYCEKLGVPFIDYNCNYEEIGLHLDEDLYSGHKLNAKGNIKLTKHIGEYLLSDFPELFDCNYTRETTEYFDELYNDYYSTFSSSEFEKLENIE